MSRSHVYTRVGRGLALAEMRPTHWVSVLHLGLEGCSGSCGSLIFSCMLCNGSIVPPPPPSALQWCRRRDKLDRQEAELLKRVQGVREKVVDHMTKQKRSHDKRDQ